MGRVSFTRDSVNNNSHSTWIPIEVGEVGQG